MLALVKSFGQDCGHYQYNVARDTINASSLKDLWCNVVVSKVMVLLVQYIIIETALKSYTSTLTWLT